MARGGGTAVSLAFLARAAVVYAGAIPLARIAPLRKESGKVRWNADRAIVDRFHAALRPATHIDVWYRNVRLTYAVRRGKVTDGCLDIQCPALEARVVGWQAMPSERLVLGQVEARSPTPQPRSPFRWPQAGSSRSVVS